MKNRFLPDEKYIFPASGPRNLKFQRKWLHEYNWLTYSKKYDGAYCRFCVFFSPKEVGKGAHFNVKPLVKEAFRNWQHAKEKFNFHQQLEYHKASVVFAQNFIDVHDKKTVSIDLQLNKAKKIEIEQNRKVMSSIIETIIFIGRQEIACRGHRDSGLLSLEYPISNDGNFRSLLRFRISSGDNDLKKHFEAPSLNQLYTSPIIQNEIIEICGKIIQEEIVKKINESKSFSILADETTDISGVEQFSLCARYIDFNNGNPILKEDFLKFVPVKDVTGEGLAQTLITTCKELSINFDFLRGQGYDGASAMSGKFQGCASRVMVHYPSALYVHCASHCLNLAIGDACSIPAIRNSIGSIKEIIFFFRCSAKRQSILNDKVLESDCEMKKKRLKKYCETRWIERLDAIVVFKEFFAQIFAALENIQETGNSEASKKAFSFQQTLKNGYFIIAMLVTNRIFTLAQPLSTSLQSVYIDLCCAIEMVESLKNLLLNIRENAEEKFHEIFIVAENLSNEIGEEITIPRLAQYQRHRENYDPCSTEEYYRVAVFIPFIEHFINQLEIRFLKQKEVLCKIQNIIPNKVIKLNETEIDGTCDVILAQWANVSTAYDTVCKQEIVLWKQKWIDIDNKPRTFIDALQFCDEVMFPNVYSFLKIGSSLPVTVSSVERSFSSLKRIKTYLRNSTEENRLNGLALMSIHRGIPLKINDVIERFAEKNRRISL